MSTENPRGKGSADDSTASDDKDFSCDYCNESYDNQPALNSHVGHKHSDEIRRTVPCDYCGSGLRRTDAEIERYNNQFCDLECRGKHRSESGDWDGVNHPRYNSNTVECDYCGNELVRNQWRIDNYEKQYCGMNCRANHVKETGQRKGENNPAYNSETIECAQCGDEVTIPVSLIERGQKCCGAECAYEYKSETYRGENNWNYTGYNKERYGDDWEDTRKQVRERDDHECQDCGITEGEYGRELDVHHIIPLREFESAQKANEIDNLLSLCMSCHHKWEGLYLRPDTR